MIRELEETFHKLSLASKDRKRKKDEVDRSRNDRLDKAQRLQAVVALREDPAEERSPQQKTFLPATAWHKLVHAGLMTPYKLIALIDAASEKVLIFPREAFWVEGLSQSFKNRTAQKHIASPALAPLELHPRRMAGAIIESTLDDPLRRTLLEFWINRGKYAIGAMLR